MFLSILRRSFFLLVFLTLGSLLGCVGTLQDTAEKFTKTGSPGSDEVIFQGVTEVVPISSSKVEVYFSPAVGDPSQYTYLLYYNNNPIPASFDATTLNTDYRGLLRVVASGLLANTSYSFRVEVRSSTDKGELIESVSKKYLSAQTFPNLTAVFNGISNVYNLGGSAGSYGFEIRWFPAEPSGSGPILADKDAYLYEVTVVDGDNYTPGDLSNELLTAPERNVYLVDPDKTNFIVSGLRPGGRYFARVRCIHVGFNKNSSNPEYRREKNNKYLEISTFDNDVGNLVVDKDSFAALPPSGRASLTSVDLEWAAPLGLFTEYRIYVGPKHPTVGLSYVQTHVLTELNNVCSGIESTSVVSSPERIICKKVNSIDINASFAGLVPLKDYEVMLLACSDSSCSSFTPYTAKTFRTEPPVASFTGIAEIEGPREFSLLDRVYLSIVPPDLDTGYVDGLIIEDYRDSSNIRYISYPNSFTNPNPSDLGVLPFDAFSSEEIIITGVNPSSGSNSCFRVYPYTILPADPPLLPTSQVVLHNSGVIESCILVDIPGSISNADEFSGLNYCSTLSPFDVQLAWSSPSDGLWDKYIVFYAKTSDVGAFNFNNVFASYPYDLDNIDPNYSFQVVNRNEVDTVVSGLQGATSYEFGVLSYFSYMGNDYFSEINSGTESCTTL